MTCCASLDHGQDAHATPAAERNRGMGRMPMASGFDCGYTHPSSFKALRCQRTKILALMLPLLISACATRTKPIEPQQRERRVQVQWLGHAAFLIRSSIGITVLADPFDPELLPYPLPDAIAPDVVLISHESPASDHLEIVDTDPQVFRTNLAAGHFSASSIVFHGVPTISAGEKDAPFNTAFSWEMDGVRFVHLGSPTDELPRRAARELARPDVLFLPVGYPPQLDDDEREKIIHQLKPQIIVPMAYATEHAGNLPLFPLEPWLEKRERVIYLDEPGFAISKKSLPSGPTVFVPAAP